MTIFEGYNHAKKSLKESGIEDYVFEAKQIIKHITGLSSAQILTDYNRRLTRFEQNNLIAILHQRKVRYPLQYIFGEWDFFGRPYFVGPGVLIPRADTETVVQQALTLLKDIESPAVLDLCAGSGCIGITIAKEREDAFVTMVEKFDCALNFLNKNISRHSVKNGVAIKGDVLKGAACDKLYDLIVSNPPYIKKGQPKIISPEVEFEPESALFAEDDGLEFYKAIINNYTSALKEGGAMVFETGFDQSATVAQLLTCAGYTKVDIQKDLSGIGRAVSGIKNTNLN
ncbi:MAG: peptide chain release factor N(5)-glutamine methyltransferase [Acutalibacteraceae bacterium]|jgi:release factor glutamine methyltransferase